MPKSSKNGSYSRIARIYDVLDYPSEVMYYRSMRKQWIGELRDETILEIGVGTGKNLPYYHESNRVIGFDQEIKMLDRAKRRKERGVGAEIDLVLQEKIPWGLPQKDYTTIVATFVFCTMSDPTPVLEELKKYASKGCRLIIFEYTRSSRRALKFVNWMVNPVTRRLFGVDFKRKPTREFIDVAWEVEKVTPIVDDWIEVVELVRL